MKNNFDELVKERNKIDKKIQSMQKKMHKQSIQAAEGNIDDITSTSITGRNVNADADLKRNSYKTYQKTIRAMYDMYNSTLDFGSEFFGSVIDTRVSFIAGGGCTVLAQKQNVAKAISDFLEYNKMLEGSKLFENVGIAELEGKDLMVLIPDKTKEKIKVRSFYSVPSPYLVKMDEKDNQVIKEITYNSNDEKKGQSIAKETHLVFIKIGGTADKVNDTMPKVGRCLTDIENASRIKYDLRYNNHLYGKLTYCFQTAGISEAKALNNLLVQTNWKPGTSYAGTAKVYVLGPPPEASEVLAKELIMSCRIISINTGIPIHWLSYPDLMSNRATAENMLEVINAATIKEREIWEEGLTELVLKAGRIGYLNGFKEWKNINLDKEEFEIKLPLISLAALKQIQETWIPLEQMGYISKQTVRNRVPGLNPLVEKKMIEDEEESKEEGVMEE